MIILSGLPGLWRTLDDDTGETWHVEAVCAKGHIFFVNVFSSIYCTSFHSYLCMSDRLARPRKIFAGMDEPDVVPHVACCTMESVCNAKLFNYFMGFI